MGLQGTVEALFRSEALELTPNLVGEKVKFGVIDDLGKAVFYR